MSRITFLYFLFSKDRRPLYVKNGQVKEGNPLSYTNDEDELASLKEAPEGWRETLVKYARNIKYFGLFRDMTVAMKFPGDGAEILKNRMWSFGVECVCYLGMAKLDRLSLPYNYKAWHMTEINFVKYKEQKDFVSVEALEGGPSKYLKAYEGANYEIEIASDPESILVTMDGMEIENTALYSITDFSSIDPNYEFGSHVVQADVISKEIEQIGGAYSAQRTKVNNFNPNITATGQHILEATASGLVTFEYDFDLTVNYVGAPAMNPGASVQCVIRAIAPDNTTGPTHQLTLLSKTYSQGITGTHKLKGKQTLAVNAGEKIYLYTFGNPTGSTGDAQMAFTYGGSEPFLKMSYTFRGAKTNNYGLPLWRLFEKLVEKITKGQYLAKSEFLRSPEMLEYIVTSGDALRGFQDAVIKTSFADFFSSLFSRWSVGVGVEGNYIVLEKLPYFFRKETIIKLGEVKNAEVVPAEDLLFNIIKAGYKAQEYKEINGREEVNQGQEYSTPITRITKELNLVSAYRADAFGIELLRINFGQRKTTDTSSDNDTFFLHVKKNSVEYLEGEMSFEEGFRFIGINAAASKVAQFAPGIKFRISGTLSNNKAFTVVKASATSNGGLIVVVAEEVKQELNAVARAEFTSYILNRPAYTTIVGLLHPLSAFNIELSPKRGVLNNGAYIRSVLDLLDLERITFNKADKNRNLTTTLNGITISEQADIEIGSLPARLFKPYYINFTTESPINLLEIMNANPYGLVEYNWRGKTWKGFLVDGGLKPGNNDAQVWKLLASPEENFLNFNK